MVDRKWSSIENSTKTRTDARNARNRAKLIQIEADVSGSRMFTTEPLGRIGKGCKSLRPKTIVAQVYDFLDWL